MHLDSKYLPLVYNLMSQINYLVVISDLPGQIRNMLNYRITSLKHN